jgi:hypothetical protein
MTGAFETLVTAGSSDPYGISALREPAVTFDGEAVAFSGFTNGQWQIFIVMADGTRTMQVTNSAREHSEPSWHPNGWLMFTVKETNGSFALWRTDSDNNGQIIELSLWPNARDGSYAQDGTLAYIDGNGEHLIIRSMTEDSVATTYIDELGNYTLLSPVFGGVDGQVLTYSRMTRERLNNGNFRFAGEGHLLFTWFGHGQGGRSIIPFAIAEDHYVQDLVAVSCLNG